MCSAARQAWMPVSSTGMTAYRASPRHVSTQWSIHFHPIKTVEARAPVSSPCRIESPPPSSGERGAKAWRAGARLSRSWVRGAGALLRSNVLANSRLGRSISGLIKPIYLIGHLFFEYQVPTTSSVDLINNLTRAIIFARSLWVDVVTLSP